MQRALMVLVGCLVAGEASATWAIVAVDPVTGEVGAAGATCGPMVWMIAEVEPGVGAVASLCATRMKSRTPILGSMEEGSTPALALAPWTDPRDDDQRGVRQYAVAGLTGDAATFDGADCDGWVGSYNGATFAVAGNSLVDEMVLADAVEAFEAAEGVALAERLLEALEAGAARGGDQRCEPEVAAKSAFLLVANPDDGRRASVDLTASSRQGAVAALRQKWDAGKTRSCHMQCGSTSGGAWAWGVALAAALVRRRRRWRAPDATWR